ncbi:hypothetical protein TWF481_004649 [Arthrobotrys musiformis]|uniref:LysM domain-containing protein n=1 Tax=Arthrobotrys musiformis TaxID=47236 RepID=A0AAV9WL36_9PEZI
MASERIMPRQQRPGRAKQRNHTRCNSRYLNNNKAAAEEEWGPSGSQASIEEPNNQSRRAALLTNNEPKTYDQRKGRPPSPEEQETTAQERENEHVLVYIHKVQPTDTLAGVLLAYDIEAGVLRRANRLWPNDSIQMRSQLYLPVSECAVKGVPLPAREVGGQWRKPVGDQVGGGQAGDSGGSQQRPNTLRDDHGNAAVSGLQVSDGHHSFIHIDPVGPVEIVRLARPKLSHFPSSSSERVPPRPRIQDRSSVAEPQYKQPLHDISTDTFERLEVVGAAIETFVRRVAASARTNWVNKTTSDLIELTSQIGRRPQTADFNGANAGNTHKANSFPREELAPAASAASATSNNLLVRSNNSEASKSRRRIKRADGSEG